MDYNVKPIGRTCSASGDPLVPGSRCRSVLVVENGKLQRLDFSEDGWNGAPDNAVAHWISSVPEAKGNQSNPLDPDTLFEHFEQLSESPNEFQEKMRYVIALLLVRKRRLQIDGSREDDDGQFLLLSGTRGEGHFEVRDADLTEAEIEQLQIQLLPEQAA